jgi:hypothetical protein
MGRQKIPNFLFLFFSLTKFHDVCVLQATERSSTPFSFELWWSCVMGVALFPQDGPAGIISQQHIHTKKIERERNQPSRVCLVHFCRFSSIIRAPDERRWWRKQKRNQTPKHKRLHLHSEHTQWATIKRRNETKKKDGNDTHKLKHKRLDLSLFSFRLSFQFQFSSQWRCLSV